MSFHKGFMMKKENLMAKLVLIVLLKVSVLTVCV